MHSSATFIIVVTVVLNDLRWGNRHKSPSTTSSKSHNIAHVLYIKTHGPANSFHSIFVYVCRYVDRYLCNEIGSIEVKGVGARRALVHSV